MVPPPPTPAARGDGGGRGEPPTRSRHSVACSTRDTRRGDAVAGEGGRMNLTQLGVLNSSGVAYFVSGFRRASEAGDRLPDSPRFGAHARAQRRGLEGILFYTASRDGGPPPRTGGKNVRRFPIRSPLHAGTTRPLTAACDRGPGGDPPIAITTTRACKTRSRRGAHDAQEDHRTRRKRSSGADQRNAFCPTDDEATRWRDLAKPLCPSRPGLVRCRQGEGGTVA